MITYKYINLFKMISEDIKEIKEIKEIKDTVKKNDIYKYHHYALKPAVKPVVKPFGTENTFRVIRTFVKEIDLELVKPQRAGIIVYTIYQNQMYFGLGVDTISGEMTDFAGGISYKVDKNVISGALREFHEESLNVFGIFTCEDMMNSTAIYNNNNLIIFKLITVEPDLIREKFVHEYDLLRQKNELPEVCDIKWFTLSEFREIIGKRGKMFHRLQNFLQLAGEFYKFL